MYNPWFRQKTEFDSRLTTTNAQVCRPFFFFLLQTQIVPSRYNKNSRYVRMWRHCLRTRALHCCQTHIITVKGKSQDWLLLIGRWVCPASNCEAFAQPWEGPGLPRFFPSLWTVSVLEASPVLSVSTFWPMHTTRRLPRNRRWDHMAADSEMPELHSLVSDSSRERERECVCVCVCVCVCACLCVHTQTRRTQSFVHYLELPSAYNTGPILRWLSKEFKDPCAAPLVSQTLSSASFVRQW